MPQVEKWCEQAKKFHEHCSAVSQMYSRLTSIANRPLLYDLYQYAWDAKESTMLLDSYVSWLGEPLPPLPMLVPMYVSWLGEPLTPAAHACVCGRLVLSAAQLSWG